jgi:hypothetical protein
MEFVRLHMVNTTNKKHTISRVGQTQWNLFGCIWSKIIIIIIRINPLSWKPGNVTFLTFSSTHGGIWSLGHIRWETVLLSPTRSFLEPNRTQQTHTINAAQQTHTVNSQSHSVEIIPLHTVKKYHHHIPPPISNHHHHIPPPILKNPAM